MRNSLTEELATKISSAAVDRQRISGFTHNFYRYPARFSPQFAATAIECFSNYGDLVLDPYMGGGTTIVEALASGRNAVGNDLNSLATFITKVKVTPLDLRESNSLREWVAHVVPDLNYRIPRHALTEFLDSNKTRNLSLTRGRFIKKVLAGAIAKVAQLPSRDAQEFARCAILRVAQWALDGRKTHTSLKEFRHRLSDTVLTMLTSLNEMRDAMARSKNTPRVFLANKDAAEIDHLPIFSKRGELARLVVTSPPYPGIHMLYHRWQVDGRRETPAPYWIAGCEDGQGASFYNFGDRRERDAKTYFQISLLTLQATRRVMARGAVIVQMVAFGDPKNQLPRYLENMEVAGFRELSPGPTRIWRNVPNRRWHASIRGKTSSSREVVLLHEAI